MTISHFFSEHLESRSLSLLKLLLLTTPAANTSHTHSVVNIKGKTNIVLSKKKMLKISELHTLITKNVNIHPIFYLFTIPGIILCIKPGQFLSIWVLITVSIVWINVWEDAWLLPLRFLSQQWNLFQKGWYTQEEQLRQPDINMNVNVRR